MKEACKHFTVVLLDQRGTGRSSPIRASVLAARGDTAAQVAYLRHFRADSIVRDAELVRAALSADRPGDAATAWRRPGPALPGLPGPSWAILGQSFGGFCCLAYLSLAPAGVGLKGRGARALWSLNF